jgi:hypothetical protein
MNRRTFCTAIGLSLSNEVVSAESAYAEDPAKIFKILPANFSVEALPVDAPPLDNLREARLLFQMRSLRTSERIRQIERENVNPIPSFWDCAGISETDHPAFAGRFYEAISDVELIVLSLKKRFNRLRPSAVLPEIEPVVPVPWHSSYPSGHATQATVIAEILTKVAPESATRLRRLAVEVGVNREVAGLHYPSDTAAGVTLGRWLAKQSFFQNDAGLRSF